MLGAEINSLPEDIANEASRFFNLNIEWLEAALSPPGKNHQKKSGNHSRAVTILSALSGAMIVSRATGDTSLFDQVADHLSI